MNLSLRTHLRHAPAFLLNMGSAEACTITGRCAMVTNTDPVGRASSLVFEWLAMVELDAETVAGSSLNVVTGTDGRKVAKVVEAVRQGKQGSTTAVLYTPLGIALYAIDAYPREDPTGDPICELRMQKCDSVAFNTALAEDGRCKLVVAANAPFCIVGVTAEFEQQFGFRRELALDRTLGLIQGPETDVLGWHAICECALKGDTAKLVVKAYTKDGAVRSCHMRVRPVLERGSARYLEMTFCDPAHMEARGSAERFQLRGQALSTRRPSRSRMLKLWLEQMLEHWSDDGQAVVVDAQPDAHPPPQPGGSVAPQSPLARERSARKNDPVRAGVSRPKSKPRSQSPENRPPRKMSAPLTRRGEGHTAHNDAKGPSTNMGSVVRMITKLEVSRARQRARAGAENGHLLYRYGYHGDGALSLLWSLVVMLFVALRIMSPPKMESGAGSRGVSGAGSLMEVEDAEDALVASEVARLRIIAGERAITDKAPGMKPLLRTLSDPSGSASGAWSLPHAVASRHLSTGRRTSLSVHACTTPQRGHSPIRSVRHVPPDIAPVPVVRRSLSNPPAVRLRRSLSKPLPPVSAAEQEDRDPRKVLSRTYSNPGSISRNHSNPGSLSRSDETRRGEAVGQRKLREYNSWKDGNPRRLKSRNTFSKVLL